MSLSRVSFTPDENNMTSSMASKHSAFPFNEVLASKVLATTTDFASFTRSANSRKRYVFQAIIHYYSLYSLLSLRGLELVWLKIIWFKGSPNPEWLLKGLSEVI